MNSTEKQIFNIFLKKIYNEAIFDEDLTNKDLIKKFMLKELEKKVEDFLKNV